MDKKRSSIRAGSAGLAPERSIVISADSYCLTPSTAGVSSTKPTSGFVVDAASSRIEASAEPPLEQLGAIAKVLLRSWRDQPDLVRVMVREVARSPQLQGQVDEIGAVFLVIQRVIERGQADGSFRPDLDPRLASWIFYGGLEELLTGWVLGQLPDGEEEVARAERTVVDLVCGGLTRDGAAAPV